MGLMMKEKKAVTKEVAKRYQKASKKQKGVILREFVALTGYNRCYASYVLRNLGKRVIVRVKGKIVAVILGQPRQKIKRQRKRIYDENVLHVLRSIWFISDYICGKRLAPLLKEIIPRLEKFKEIKLNAKTKEKLLRISPATIDFLWNTGTHPIFFHQPFFFLGLPGDFNVNLL